MHVLLVVGAPGSLTVDDTWVSDRLTVTLGHTRDLADDGAPVADTSPYDLIVLANSAVNSSTRGDYDEQPVPVMAVSAGNLPDLEIQANTYPSGGSSQANAWFATHEINDTLTGTADIYTTAQSTWFYGEANLAAGVVVLARNNDGGDRILAGCAEVGATLYDGSTAPHRILFMAMRVPSAVNTAGAEWFDRGVAWAVNTGGGDPIPQGAATGAAAWTGTATGTAPELAVPTGTATGATAWAASATGDAPTVPAATGAAAGAVQWAGAASGASTRTGAATGAVAWSGGATGTSVRKGTAGGTLAWAGTAAGTTTKRGTAVGAVQWAGASLGFAPTVDGASGLATGTTTWAGAATGRRQPQATAGGLTTWAATATGTTTRSGAATGTTTWTGAAHAVDIDGWQDITVTATLGERRRAAAILDRPWAAELAPRAHAAALEPCPRTGTLHDRRWTGALP